MLLAIGLLVAGYYLYKHAYGEREIVPTPLGAPDDDTVNVARHRDETPILQR